MPRCTPCIIPYNGKVRQESLQFREPMTAGVVLFTKSSREGHDFAAIIFYSILVPNKRTYLFFLPLLFSNTHRQKALTLPRSGSSVVLRQAVRFCVHQPPLSKADSPYQGESAFRKGATVEKILQCSQKIHAAVTILPQLSGILYASPERMKIFLLLLSLLYKHTQANGPDHPGQGRLPFCRRCEGMLQGNIEKLSAARSRANSLSSS